MSRLMTVAIVALIGLGTAASYAVSTDSLQVHQIPSGSENATYPNWGRKLARVPNSGQFHAVYQDDGDIYYVYSTDHGTTWSEPEHIDHGYDPSLALNASATGLPYTPWVAYRTATCSLKLAIRQSQDWLIRYVAQPGGMRVGAPSLAAGLHRQGQEAYAHVVYPLGSIPSQPDSAPYIHHITFTERTVSNPFRVDSVYGLPLRVYGPSVAVTPDISEHAHVAWKRGDRIMYRTLRADEWSAIHPISTPVDPISEPASNPALEAYGDYVYCVWSGPNEQGGFPADIWQSKRFIHDPPEQWSDPVNQSRTPDQESNFPVMTTDFVTVWQETYSAVGSEIWAKFGPDPGSGPLFQTHQPSRYPHAEGYWIEGPGITFLCNTLWTEELPAGGYEVWFGTKSWIPRFGDEYEPASFYEVTVGEPNPSPYCRVRDGARAYRSFRVDSAANELVYDLRFLDPRRAYDARAVVYHEGKTDWLFELRADTVVLGQIKARPGVPETVRVRLPDRAYRRTRAELGLRRLKADYAPLAGLKLFRVEERESEKDGPLSAGAGPVPALRLEPNAPNPFRNRTAIRYQLPHAGRVLVRVYDPAGRQVRLLRDETQDPGRHSVAWDGRDSQGRAMPAGVYF